MTPSELFSLVSTFALVAWLYLIAAARWTPRVFSFVRYAVPILFSLVYIVCLLVGDPVEGGGFRTLEGVAALFTSEWALLGGWIHYLAFDFFVGCWIVSRSKEEGIHHLWVVVPLFFTFLLGPVGLLLFLILLGVRRRRGM